MDADLIKLAALIIGLVVWVISQLAGKGKAVQPPPINNPARRQQQQQRPQPQRPKAQAPVNTDLRKEIEAFLKQATGQQGPKQPQPTLADRGGRGSKPARQQAPRREEVAVEVEVIPEPLAERRPRPAAADDKQSRRQREFQERAAHMADDVEDAAKKLEQQIQKKFDHNVGALAGSSGARQSAFDAGTSVASRSSSGVDAQTMMDRLRNPVDVRQAVIMSEILKRPEHRW